MGKGAETHDRIVDEAIRLASRDGFDGVTLGALATELGISKSGLFAHFKSKDDLQVEALRTALDRFRERVVVPALKARRGEPRIVALFDRWLAWGDDTGFPGGCIVIAAAIEFDDKAGPQRDLLVDAQRDWFAALARATQIAVDEKHFRPDVDPDQLAFELYSIILGYHHAKRLLRDPKALSRCRTAFERLLVSARV